MQRGEEKGKDWQVWQVKKTTGATGRIEGPIGRQTQYRQWKVTVPEELEFECSEESKVDSVTSIVTSIEIP